MKLQLCRSLRRTRNFTCRIISELRTQTLIVILSGEFVAERLSSVYSAEPRFYFMIFSPYIFIVYSLIYLFCRISSFFVEAIAVFLGIFLQFFINFLFCRISSFFVEAIYKILFFTTTASSSSSFYSSSSSKAFRPVYRPWLPLPRFRDNRIFLVADNVSALNHHPGHQGTFLYRTTRPKCVRHCWPHQQLGYLLVA
jgi:hypothetical protein